MKLMKGLLSAFAVVLEPQLVQATAEKIKRVMNQQRRTIKWK